ncbi:MAG: glycosyltransferase family 39 protein [bacterium]|nr:glycosyltransferase family 39 protein [bacterium]
MNTNNNSKNIWLSDYMIIGYFSFFTLILHLIAIEGFGYFRDELYYISCSEHLDFGYVDHPPFSIILLKLIRIILGDSVIAIRLLPVIGAAVFVFMTGLIAKELGGKKFSLALASATAIAPVGNFFMYSIYSMNFLDHLFWIALIFIVLKIINTNNPKYWLWFGLTAGIGLQNKISVLFLLFGIAVGILLTKERKHLKSKHLWLGAGIAGLIFLPYIIWNMAHGWPTLEFMHNARTMKMAAVSPLSFLKDQILHNNPATLLVWITGLWFFLFNEKGKKYRLFGWMYVSIFLLFIIQQAKPYYLAAIYPVLFAGGAVMIESWLQKKEWRWPKPVLVPLILVSALFFAPIGLPILSRENTSKWLQMIGLDANSGENHKIGALPQHFADMHGWEEMVEKVAGVYNKLSAEEKKECIIYGSNYGVTGALNFMGKAHGLPPAFSGHNNHFFWRPEGFSGNILIAVGGSKKRLETSFDEVIEMDRTDCKYAMPYENNKPIYLCRGIKKPLNELWPNVKKFI